MRQAQVVWLAAFSAVGAPTAEAQPGRLIYSGTSYDLRVTEPVPVVTGAEDLRSFVLRVINTTGDPAFDMTRFDGTGLAGISGQLHNEQYGMGLISPTQRPTAIGTEAAASTVDTHFLPSRTGGPYIDSSTLEEALVDESTSASQATTVPPHL